ncbi:MAG TPA: sigma-70 family RNA polymerase sigma factor [Candidatus Saccharimonadales bacterium]|nr:sigma-70 family RNA polymerase sigma factor [Candidatus Saccharimonadales bacterium]
MKPNFETTVTRYVKLVYYFANRWSTGPKTEIDDIVQETFYKALQKYDTFEFSTESGLKAWLLTICRNHIYNTGRRKKEILLEPEEMENIPDEKNANTMLETIIKKEQLSIIYSYLENRPFIERELVRLYAYEELKFKEIANVLDCSKDAVKKRFYRIIERMKKEAKI